MTVQFASTVPSLFPERKQAAYRSAPVVPSEGRPETANPYADRGVSGKAWTAFEQATDGLDFFQRLMAEMALFILPTMEMNEGGTTLTFREQLPEEMDWTSWVRDRAKPFTATGDDPAAVESAIRSREELRQREGKPPLTEEEKGAIVRKMEKDVGVVLHALDTFAFLLSEASSGSLDITG